MSDDLTDLPDDDSAESSRGKRISDVGDDEDSGELLDTPPLPSVIADAIAEAGHDGPPPAAPVTSETAHSRRMSWAELRAERASAREAAERHAQDEAAEAARQRALEQERRILAARHVEEHDRAELVDPTAEAEAESAGRASEAAEAAAAMRAAEQEAAAAPAEEQPSEDEEFARRWAEAEAQILRAQEEQRARTERALAAQNAQQDTGQAAAPEAPASVAPAAEPAVSVERDEEERAQPRRDATSSLGSVRSKLASLVWLVAVLAALVLAVGALLVALELSRDNAIVDGLLDAAAAIDFGVFKEFEGQDAATRSALVNWGLAAVIWLIVGKVLDKLIRP